MAVQTTPAFRVTDRELLFENIYFGPGDTEYTEYDVHPGGGRFPMIKPGQADG